MKCKALSTLLVGAMLAACSPSDQGTPFDVSEDGVVERTINTSGGTLSSPAGASVSFPAGALTQPLTITVEPVSAADALGPLDGTPLEGTTFLIEPSGTSLSSPAGLELSFDPASLSSTQLLGLGAFQSSANGTNGLNQVSADLTAGILKTEIDELGTVTARIARDFVTPVAGTAAGQGGALASRQASGLAGIAPQNEGGSVTYQLSCGWLSASRHPCLGTGQFTMIQLLVSDALVEQYPDLGAVIGGIDAQFTFEDGYLTAAVRIDVSIRAIIGSSLASHAVTYILASGGLGSFNQPFQVPYTVDDHSITFETAEGQVTLEYTAEDDLLELILRPEQEFVIKGVDGVERSHRVAVVARLRQI